jgi:acyl dehydratase
MAQMEAKKVDFDDLRARVGQELGVSDWLTVDQSRIDQFAECTGDDQWIHVDVERARRESPFGAPVAHGYLTLSLLALTALEILIRPAGITQAFNYGLDRVRFIAPVKVGSRIRNRIRLLSVDEKPGARALLTTENTIEIEGEDKPALTAVALAMIAR